MAYILKSSEEKREAPICNDLATSCCLSHLCVTAKRACPCVWPRLFHLLLGSAFSFFRHTSWTKLSGLQCIWRFAASIVLPCCPSAACVLFQRNMLLWHGIFWCDASYVWKWLVTPPNELPCKLRKTFCWAQNNLKAHTWERHLTRSESMFVLFIKLKH